LSFASHYHTRVHADGAPARCRARDGEKRRDGEAGGGDGLDRGQPGTNDQGGDHGRTDGRNDNANDAAKQMLSQLDDILRNLKPGSRDAQQGDQQLGRMLDELSQVPGVRGVMLTFDDFVIGMEQFGTRIMPLMRCLDKTRKAA
jgi:hypothetical protein